jgi:uncharacterized repeat protein (TIGR01451 family)
MKKISTSFRSFFLTLIFISLFCETRAQMVYLPDTNFRNKLINLGYGSCIAGDSIDSNCPLVASATYLQVSYSNIHDLQGIQAFGNLDQLFCSSDSLSYMPPLPSSLTAFGCAYNQLTNLPSLPSTLTDLNCRDNQLTNLPSLPSTLTALNCQNNQLTNLPTLPNLLTMLVCEYNQLTNLPTLPNSLNYLYCTNNQLTNLPTIPSTLSFLRCGGNQLANLPSLPTLLGELRCNFNQLTNLPSLPSSLTELDCSYNLLTNLPELPDSLYDFIFNNNPNLQCLPQLKRVVNLYFTSTGVSCLPNYGNVTSSTPVLSSLPLCGLYNTGGCGSFYNITGKSYFDSNTNCLYESGDFRQGNEHILLYKNGNLIQQAFTGGEGYYSFDVNDSLGDYNVELDTNNIPFTVLCPLNISYNDTITVADTVFYDNDFALKCKAGFDLGVGSISGFPFRPAHNTTVHIQAGDMANFYGANCASGISGAVTISFTGPISYISPAIGALTPNNVSGNVLTYNVADFGAVDLFTAFNIIIHTDTFAVIGSQVCFTVSVSPTIGDNNISNNILTHCFTVQTSYDPNNKEVYPINDVDVNGDRWLTYTINFQNTGTASAEHIYVTDTLSSNFDLSTFQLLAYNHQPLVQILEGGIARFNFPNINLPDSNTNEPLSHGYVQYKIKLKDGLSVGTQTTNMAYIYFDFNTPVVTNTTSNTLVVTGISSIANSNVQLKVYPNPSANIFHFQFSDLREQIKRIVITDITGREVYSVEKNMNELNTSELTNGIYFYSVLTKNEKLFVGKLIKN